MSGRGRFRFTMREFAEKQASEALREMLDLRPSELMLIRLELAGEPIRLRTGDTQFNFKVEVNEAAELASRITVFVVPHGEGVYSSGGVSLYKPDTSCVFQYYSQEPRGSHIWDSKHAIKMRRAVEKKQ